jgi:hypothetical protein
MSKDYCFLIKYLKNQLLKVHYSQLSLYDHVSENSKEPSEIPFIHGEKPSTIKISY